MGSAILVEGHLALRKALQNYAPDLLKISRKEVAAALIPIVNEARGHVPPSSPMSGWAPRSFSEARWPFYYASIIKRGIGYQTSPSRTNRFGWSALARIENKTRIGAIYETAGRKNGQGQEWVGPKAGGLSRGVSRSVNPRAGNQFISNLGQLYGTKKETGRLIYRAWENDRGKANDAYFKAVNKANDNLVKRSAMFNLTRAA